MSRIAKKPIAIPAGIKISVKDRDVHVEGPKGKMSGRALDQITVEVKGSEVTLKRAGNSIIEKTNIGTTHRMITNMIAGVTTGFRKTLLIEGVGFKGEVKGQTLALNLGFTHIVNLEIPQGIAVKAVKPTELLIEGNSKENVGQFAAKVRSIYEPEPYKGKGVRYSDEVVRRKAGKAVVK